MITSESRGSVRLVRFARADEHNAMLPAMLEALIVALHHAETDNAGAVVLTAEGNDFCVGADLNWLASLRGPADGVAELVSVHHRAILTLSELPMPVVAAVNGSAAGGGLSFALAADYCLAASTATFVAAYFRLGLTPDGGNSLFLQRAIGAARTREMLLTNRRLSALQALAWGLINEVVEPEALVDRAVELAASLASVPGESLRQTRKLLDGGALRQRLDLEAEAICQAARRDAFKAALDAFRERRPRR